MTVNPIADNDNFSNSVLSRRNLKVFYKEMIQSWMTKEEKSQADLVSPPVFIHSLYGTHEEKLCLQEEERPNNGAWGSVIFQGRAFFLQG